MIWACTVELSLARGRAGRTRTLRAARAQLMDKLVVLIAVRDAALAVAYDADVCDLLREEHGLVDLCWCARARARDWAGGASAQDESGGPTRGRGARSYAALTPRFCSTIRCDRAFRLSAVPPQLPAGRTPRSCWGSDAPRAPTHVHRRARVAQGWKGWALGEGGVLHWRLTATINFIAKWHYATLALGRGLNVLYLDTDVHLVENPMPVLNDPFWRRFDMIIQTDLYQPPSELCVAANATTVGASCGPLRLKAPNLNTGVVYVRRAAPGTPLFGLLNGTVSVILDRLAQGAERDMPICHTCFPDFAPAWDMLWEQYQLNELLRARPGSPTGAWVWHVVAAPAAPPPLWREGGPTVAVAWARPWQDEHANASSTQSNSSNSSAWPTSTIAAAPDWLFGRMCAVAATMNAKSATLASLARLGRSLPYGIHDVEPSVRDGRRGGTLLRASSGDAVQYGVPPDGCKTRPFVDVIAPLVAAHAVFTSTAVREKAWRALGWWHLHAGRRVQRSRGHGLMRAHEHTRLLLDGGGSGAGGAGGADLLTEAEEGRSAPRDDGLAHCFEGRDGEPAVLLSHYYASHAARARRTTLRVRLTAAPERPSRAPADCARAVPVHCAGGAAGGARCPV